MKIPQVGTALLSESVNAVNYALDELNEIDITVHQKVLKSI